VRASSVIFFPTEKFPVQLGDMALYPLKFHPRLVEKMWGGRKIETVLGKPLPQNKPIGESWELFDFPPGVVEKSNDWVSAQIANGPLAGRSLHWAVGEFGSELTGNVPLAGAGQFPILIKFLDAREDLSVQVHPPQEYADAHPEAHLKSEAWYVLENDPGARIFKGLAPGVTKGQYQASLVDGTSERFLKSIPVREGDCYYLPSGTVHALGAGILAAEVQTPSDTTFRVFDFNRVDPSSGKQRTLHVEQAMQCIDFSGKPERRQEQSHAAGAFTTVTNLVTCPYFTMDKVRLIKGVEQPIPYDDPVVWIMLEGEAELRVDGVAEATTVKRGETVLLPAAMEKPMIRTKSDCVWIEVTFPVTASSAGSSNR
jgi:mannose-6-phosphate isomerase